ncbi:hypothetical protein IAT38_006723 [Cryptococcus sp. DSM 104549]
MASSLRKRLILIGIGGASCSGKTLLAKHIRRVLPQGSILIHQDDFCPPAEEVPYNANYPDLQDWDDPETCIQWSKFRAILQDIRSSGHEGLHASHDHLNKENKIAIDESVFERWRTAFQALSKEEEARGVQLVWAIVDGFVLYYDMPSVEHLDIRIFLRVPHDVLKQRRDERQVYVLQHPDDAAAGGVWTDPPQYFEKIVWPGYIKAHEGVFDGVESGPLKPEWGPEGKDLRVISPDEGVAGMTLAFDKSCQAIVEGCKKGAGTFIS